jgi:hypothetical protein
MGISGDNDVATTKYAENLGAAFKKEFEKREHKKRREKRFKKPSMGLLSRMMTPRHIAPAEVKKDAQQMTTDFQLSRIKTLERRPKQAARYASLGEALTKEVWAANEAPEESTPLVPKQTVPTPCSALIPDCFFGRQHLKPPSPAPTPTASELKLNSLHLGIKGPALVAECKEKKQWERAMEVLTGFQMDGRVPSHDDAKFIINGCQDATGQSWNKRDGKAHFDVGNNKVVSVVSVPAMQPP